MENSKKNPSMALRYSTQELQEFEVIILKKLESAKHELQFMLESLDRSGGSDSLPNSLASIDDGSENMEREKLSQLAIRQRSFIGQLEDALVRIKNGTYGICKATGKLIDKNRLRAVPHTTHSIEAKLKNKI